MPPDLTAFAKEYDIQLLTHNDPKGESRFLSYCRANLCVVLVDAGASNVGYTPTVLIKFSAIIEHLKLFCFYV